MGLLDYNTEKPERTSGLSSANPNQRFIDEGWKVLEGQNLRITPNEEQLISLGKTRIAEGEHGFWGEAVAGLGRGALRVAATPAYLADVAGEAVGWKGLEQAGEWGAEKVEKFIEESPGLRKSASISGDIRDNPQLWTDPRWYASIVGEGAPTIASMFIPGMAAARVAKVAGMGAKAVQAARMGGALTAGMGLEAGGAAEDIRQYEKRTGEKVPISTKLKTVTGTGVVAGSLEAIPIFNIFGGAVAKKLIGRIITSMALEGGTEGAQEIVANAFAKAGYEPDRDMVGGVIESVVGGVLLGGGMGAMQNTFQERISKTDPAEVADLLEQAEKEIAEKPDIVTMIDEGMTTGEINGEPFTPEIATGIIQEAYADKALTDTDLDAFREKYPDLRPIVNDIVGENVKDKINAEMDAVERAKIEAEKAYRKTPEARQKLIEAEMPILTPEKTKVALEGVGVEKKPVEFIGMQEMLNKPPIPLVNELDTKSTVKYDPAKHEMTNLPEYEKAVADEKVEKAKVEEIPTIKKETEDLYSWYITARQRGGKLSQKKIEDTDVFKSGKRNINEIIVYLENKGVEVVAKSQPPKPPKAKPPEAATEEIEGEVIPEVKPKVEKEIFIQKNQRNIFELRVRDKLDLTGKDLKKLIDDNKSEVDNAIRRGIKDRNITGEADKFITLKKPGVLIEKIKAMPEVKVEKEKVEVTPEEKVEVEITPEGKEISVDLTKKEEVAVTPKQQKEYLLAEIDKAIEIETTKIIKERPEIDEKTAMGFLGKGRTIAPSAEYTFEVPNDGTFKIIANSLLEFQRRVKGTFPATIISKQFKPTKPAKKAVPTAKYNKIIVVPPKDLKPADIDRLFKEVADTEARDITGPILLNPFQNWLLSQDITKAVKDKIKSVAGKDYIEEARVKIETQDIEYARSMVEYTRSQYEEAQSYHSEYKAGEKTLKQIAEETGVKRSGNELAEGVSEAKSAYYNAVAHLEKLEKPTGVEAPEGKVFATKGLSKELQPFISIAKESLNAKEFYENLTPVERDVIRRTEPEKGNQAVYDFFEQITGIKKKPKSKITKENIVKIQERAKDFYGLTRNPKEAGYILDDGLMLDFSGRHYATGYKEGKLLPGEPDYLRGEKNVDHREIDIEKIFKTKEAMSGNEAMTKFETEGNAIRMNLIDDILYISFVDTQQITPKQWSRIAMIFRRFGATAVYDVYNENDVRVGSGEVRTITALQRAFKKPQFATKAIKPQDTITRADLKSIFAKMKNISTGVDKDGNFFFRPIGKPVITIYEVNHIEGYIDTSSGQIPVGSYLRDQIELKTKGVGPTADEITLLHEYNHFLEENNIISGNDIKVISEATAKDLGINVKNVTSHQRGDYIGKVIVGSQSQKNLRIRRVLKKIADFVNSIYELVTRTRTARGVLADIETGAILSEKELSAVNQFAQDVSFSLKKAAKAVTNNPNFVRWFGDSKVLNKDGSPMVVYHGTDKDFTVFRESAFDVGIHLGTAEQASDRLEFKAGEDITLPKQAILPLYVKMENPLALKTDPGLFNFANFPWALDELGEFTEKEINSLKDYEGEDYRLEDEFTEGQDLLFARKELMDRFRQDVHSLLSKHGYDGIKYWNTGEIKGMAAIVRRLNAAESKTELSDIYEEKVQLEKTGGDWSYVAFEPTQIKSIYNTGKFGITEPDIMFATKPTPDYKEMLKRYQEAHTTPLVDETVEKTKIKHFYNLEKVSSQPAWIKEKFGRAEKTLTEKIGDNVGAFRKNWQTRLLDKLHPIKALGETAYMLHRLETGAQATMAMFMRHGKLRWQEKALTIDTQKQGFMPWLDNLGDDAQKLFYWMAAKRAEVLETEGREKWLDIDTRKKIFDWVGEKPKSAKNWRMLNNQFQEFNKSVLNLAQQSGLINPIKRATWEQEFYVPFYRIFEDAVAREEFLKGPLMGKKHISAQIKRLLGAEMKIGDPLENVIRNWSHLIHESVRNMARAEAYDYAQKNKIKSGMTDESGRLMPLIETVKASELNIYRSDKEKRMVYVTKKGDDNILSFQKNGRRVYFKVNDAEMFNALSDVNHRQFNGFLVRACGQAKRWLTYGATFGPAFKVANMLRDSLHTAIISKSFIPFIDSGKGIVKALREDADYVKFMASGAGFGSSYIRAENPQALAEYINRIVKKEGRGAAQRILDTPKKMLDFWEKLGAASENAARVQLYTKRIAEGETHLKAAFEGRDLMDFTMRGDSQVVQFLIRTVPFMNARAQGLYKLGRAAKQDPKSFLIKGSMLTMATLALWAINRDEDEWKELEDWDKRTYYHFWIGDKHYRIPKPFETGAIFSTVFEGMAEVMSGDEEFGYFVDVIKDIFLDTFAMNPIPQAVRPLIEQWSNKSFFTGRPIEGQSLQRLRPGERKTAWTSETMQLAGKLGVSPKRAEEIIRGYFSTFGMFLLGIADIFSYHLADFPVNPTKEIDDYLLLGRFIKERVPARHTKYQTEFYEIFREVDQLVATVNNYKKLGNYKKAITLAKKERKNLIKRKELFAVRRQLAEINAKLRRIMSSRILTAEQKRAQVDKLIEYKNKITKRAYEIYVKE